MSDSINGSLNIKNKGTQEKYINIKGTRLISGLKGNFNEKLSGSRSIFLKGSINLYTKLVGSSFYINIIGTVGIKLALALILASNDNVRSNSTLTRASNG